MMKADHILLRAIITRLRFEDRVFEYSFKKLLSVLTGNKVDQLLIVKLCIVLAVFYFNQNLFIIYPLS